jgi:hypothetical protein
MASDSSDSSDRALLFAMQKVEGSNPLSRFPEIPLPSGISSFWD